MGTVYPRGRKLWIEYKDARGERCYAATDHVVGEEAKARKVLAAVEARVAAGLAHGEAEYGPVTVRRYSESWIGDRRRRGLGSVDSDQGRLNHALPSLGPLLLTEVRPKHVRDLVRELRAKCGPRPDQLAPRTVRHVYGTIHTMFEDAVADELIEFNPCKVKRGELPKKIDKDPNWRSGAVFTRAEVEAVVSDERIPHDRRVLYALLFLAGLRFGEAAALRWRSYDTTASPLGKLLVASSFSTQKRAEKSVKTEHTREVPVHGTLAKMLAAWKLSGWSAMLGRQPKPDDLLIPSREDRNRNVNHALKRFHEDLERLDLRKRRQHDARRSFITLARSDGARKDVLEWVTHGPRGDIVDLYTTLPWEALCAEVAKLRISLREGKVLALPRAANAGDGDGAYYDRYHSPPKLASSGRISGGVDGTRIIPVQQHDTPAKQAIPSLPSPAPGSQPAPRRDGSPAESRPVVKPMAEPPSVEVLRRKMDAAIVAEAWDAVKAIRERIIEEERTNVVDLEAERVRRTGSGGR